MIYQAMVTDRINSHRGYHGSAALEFGKYLPEVLYGSDSSSIEQQIVAAVS